MNITQHLRNEVLKTESHIPLLGVTAYNLLAGGITLSNTVITAGMATTLYTGNGTTQSVVTGVDMATQWGNSSSETFGGLVWLKGRSAVTNNVFVDTVRDMNIIYSNTTAAQIANASNVSSFNTNGFSVGNATDANTNLATYASWNFQTTHRITGTTNHGKAYTCHYNPFTGFTMIKYEGSGLVGHEIPHHLGRTLNITIQKDLSAIQLWLVSTNFSSDLKLNTTDAQDGVTRFISDNNVVTNVVSTSAANASTNQYIMYGWANSYFDEANTLIGNYEIGTYQGTGVAGNKVTTKGKPAWVMIKRLDAVGSWGVHDNLRGMTTGNDKSLYANVSDAETTTNDYLDVLNDGFNINGSSGSFNAVGGQYLYMVVYDNDSGSGKSKYNKATDTSALSLTATLPLAKGLDLSGSKVSVVAKNETITGVTLTQGDNYVYYYE